MSHSRVAAIAVAVAVGAFGVGRLTASSGLASNAARRGSVVAVYEGGRLGTEDVREVLPEGANALRARAAIESVVRTRVLARQAEKAGLHLTPAFLSRYTEELARLYVDETFEKPFQKRLPADEEVRKFFDENQAKLGRPERVRVAHVAFYAAREDAPARGQKRSAALAALAEARRTLSDEYGFGRTAMRLSEDPLSRAAAGELPFLTWPELALRLGPESANVAFVTGPGQLVEAPVETEQGFQIVKVLGHEQAREATFDELRDGIKARLIADRHQQGVKALMEATLAEADLKIDEKALQQLLAEEAKKSRNAQKR